jgi:chromosome partitioning protein
MAITIAVSNQKGGVGKTTSAVNLSAAFARAGFRVLLVDIDPQGNAGSGLGVSRIDPEGEHGDLYDVFLGSAPLAGVIRPSSVPGVSVVPSSPDLISIELELGRKAGRELILKSTLLSEQDNYDLVFVDCPPSSGLLTLNALGAADYLLIPLQAEYYALEGLSALLGTLDFAQKTFNPSLELLGVFLTMYDQRTRLAADVEREAREHFGERAFSTRIPRSIRLSEAPSFGLSVFEYAPESPGAKAYEELGKELELALSLVKPQDVLVANG